MRSIGVDIGEYSVKIVELVQNKKQVLINQLQEKVLTPGISEHDRDLEVIEFVRAFRASGDYSNARWNLVVRQDKVTSRFKQFPFSERSKILKSLSFEMEEDIPFNTDNCVFDVKIISTNGPTAEVIANAVPKDNVEKIVSFCKDFAIEAHTVSIEGLALANLVEDWEQNVPALSKESFDLEYNAVPNRKIQVLLNIGHKKTIFTAIENKRVIFVRSLFWGADQIVQEIIKKYQLPAIEAIKTLQTKGGILLTKEEASFEQVQFSDTISKALRELVRDLQMTLLEIESEFNAKISQIHLSGGGSLLVNLGAFLTQHLEIPCNPARLLQPYATQPLSAYGVGGSELDVDSRFALSVAIAIQGFKKPKNPAVNLLKGEFAKENNQLQEIWGDWGGTIKSVSAAVLVFFVWTYLRDDFSAALLEKGADALKTQAKSVAQLPKNKQNDSGVKNYIRERKKRISEMKLISQYAQMNSALDILKKVSESSPGKNDVHIDVVSFNVKDDLVQMSGYANSPKEISSLSQSLKSLAVDGRITEQGSSLTALPNKTSFSLFFKTDRGLTK